MKKLVIIALLLIGILGGAMAATPAINGFTFTITKLPTGTFTTLPITSITMPTITPKPRPTIIPPIPTKTKFPEPTYTIEPPTPPRSILTSTGSEVFVTTISKSTITIIPPEPTDVEPIRPTMPTVPIKPIKPLPPITSVPTITIIPKPTITITWITILPTGTITIPSRITPIPWPTKIKPIILPITITPDVTESNATMYVTFLFRHGGYHYVTQDYSDGVVTVRFMVFDDKPAIMVIKKEQVKVTYPVDKGRPVVVGVIYHYRSDGSLVRIETVAPLS